MAFLRLHLLGPPQIEYDGNRVHFTRRRALALGIYLAVTRLAHSRDALTTLFWPHADPVAGRASLRRILHVLGSTVGHDFVMMENGYVRISDDNDLWIDVEQFRQLVAASRQHAHPAGEVCCDCLPLLTQAVDLYRDDFLAGFFVPGSPDFDDWQSWQSEGLRQELAVALERLVRGYATQNNYPLALSYARRWLTVDPLHEPAHRWLIQLYAQSGQQAAALRQYAQCVDLLRTEMDLTPAPETEELYRAIRMRRLTQVCQSVPQGGEVDEEPVQADEIRMVTAVSVGLVEGMVGDTGEAGLLDTEISHLARLLTFSQEASIRYGGQVEQMAGEDILVLFGVDQVHEDDPEQGVRAAHFIQQAALTDGLPVGIGVCAGMIYCQRRPHTPLVALGSTVDLAARLRHRAEPGQILVNRQVYLASRGVFSYAPQQSLTLPGSHTPVPFYPVDDLVSAQPI